MNQLNESIAQSSDVFSAGPGAHASTTSETDSSGKPKRVFESMTIHKQYVEYHALKDSVYAQVSSLNRYSTVLITIGIVYMIYLTVSIFIQQIREPLPLVISHAILFDSVEHDNVGWMTAAFKFSGFMSAICFLIFGTYISYYKNVVKVDAMIQVKRAAGIFLSCYCIIGLIHTSFIALFCIS